VANKKRRSSAKIIKFSKSQDLNLSSFVDNLKYLEDLITEIKSNGFEATKQVRLLNKKGNFSENSNKKRTGTKCQQP
jgi:hypothetical protein